jgi:hypothetical protein
VSRCSPYVVVVLSEADRRVLTERARAYTAPHAEVVRAKIVLLAGEGLPRCDDRRAAGRTRRWGVPLAQAVLWAGAGRAAGPGPVGRAAIVSATGGGGGQGDGLRAAAAAGRAVVTVEFHRAGPRCGGRGSGRFGVRVHGAPLVGRRRDPAVALPVVDLPAGIRTSRGRPAASSTCTSALGTVRSSARTTM